MLIAYYDKSTKIKLTYRHILINVFFWNIVGKLEKTFQYVPSGAKSAFGKIRNEKFWVLLLTDKNDLR